jgi:RNA polymerase sigma-70 factor (ECF subfamily)
MYERKISNQEQRELIRRAKECDPSAFARIYEHYYQDIYNFVYYRSPSTHVAEDLTSEVFLRALESIDSYVFRGVPLSAWLFRIARTTVALYYRDQPKPTTLPLKEELLPTEAGPDDVFDMGLTKKQLAQALSKLTEEQQEVIILKFVDELSNAEVGQVLGKSEGAVKSLQHRALSSLNRVLETDRTSEVLGF